MRVSAVVEVRYSVASLNEVLVLENMWRDRVLATRQRAVRAYLRKWRLPDEILAIIASYTGCNMRGVEARHARERPGVYLIELASIAEERTALMMGPASS